MVDLDNAPCKGNFLLSRPAVFTVNVVSANRAILPLKCALWTKRDRIESQPKWDKTCECWNIKPLSLVNVSLLCPYSRRLIQHYIIIYDVNQGSKHYLSLDPFSDHITRLLQTPLTRAQSYSWSGKYEGERSNAKLENIIKIALKAKEE